MGHLMWTLKRWTENIRDWQGDKFDGIIAISGPRGLGKSTLGAALGFRLGFNPRRDIIFKREELIDQLTKRKEAVILADEMINVTYNRDFYAEEQKKLLKYLNMYRDSRNIVIACVPNFADLDKQFRELVKVRFHIVRRGLAVIHLPIESAYRTDRWDTKTNEKIEAKWLNNKKGIVRYNKLTTYAGMIKYGDLKPAQRRIYEEMKALKRNTMVAGEQAQNNKLTEYDRIYEAIRNGQIKNKEQLATTVVLMGLKYNNVTSALNNKLKNDNVGRTLSTFFIKEADETQIKTNGKSLVQIEPISTNKAKVALKT